MAFRGRRYANSYARKEPQLEQYATVLIVCEGGKSEPRYLGQLCVRYRLSNANIRITPADGTDPVSVVSHAIAEMDGFDRAYCVFDRNGHDNYDAALRQIAASKEGREGRLFGITSWPCFEVWILLHFLYSAAPFEKTGRESSCERVIRALKAYLPKYSKGDRGIFESTADKMDTAIKHALRLEAENEKSGSVNPATKMHRLVAYLIELKNAK